MGITNIIITKIVVMVNAGELTKMLREVQTRVESWELIRLKGLEKGLEKGLSVTGVGVTDTWREIVRWHQRVMVKEMVMEKAGRKEIAKERVKEKPDFVITVDRRATCHEIAGKPKEKVRAKGSNGERE